jgi:hypothetical protein
VQSSIIFRAVSLVVVLACGSACQSARPPEAPGSLSFRPTRAGSQLWLSTPFAVEVITEHEAREIEAVDAAYIGELGVSGGHVQRSSVATVAAERGATHFRVVTSGENARVDIVLYRVDRDRWEKLPASLRPASPTASL